MTEQQAKEVLILHLVDEGVLSQSEAAEALGRSRAEVLALMGKHRIPIMRYGPGDVEQESTVLHELQARRRGRTQVNAAAQLGKRSSRGRSGGWCEQGLRKLLQHPATLSAFQHLPSLGIYKEFPDLRLPSFAWRGKPHGHEPSDLCPHLEDGFINTEILPTIEHQAHVRSLLGNIGRDIETGVDPDFYVHVYVSWQYYSPHMRCHNHLSCSVELLEPPYSPAYLLWERRPRQGAMGSA